MSELGTRLKEARLEKNYSLEDLQEMTKIQKRYLAGIEEGNYSMMPGTFYVRAFIKQYAEAVGLNAEELLESYKNELPATRSEDSIHVVPSTPVRSRSLSRSTSKAKEWIPMLVVAFVIIIGIVVVWFLMQNIAKNDSDVDQDTTPVSIDEEPVDTTTDQPDTQTGDEPDKTPEETPEQPVEEPVTPPLSIVQQGVQGETTTYTVSNAETFTLKIVATGNSWISVKDANQQELMKPAREVKAGETLSLDLTNTQQARVRIGASPGIKVFINDQEVTYGISPSDRVTQNMIFQFQKSQ